MQLNKAKILGNTRKVGVSQSPFKTINGSIKIRIPDKIAIEEDNSINVRGPFELLKKRKWKKSKILRSRSVWEQLS